MACLSLLVCSVFGGIRTWKWWEREGLPSAQPPGRVIRDTSWGMQPPTTSREFLKKTSVVTDFMQSQSSEREKGENFQIDTS